MLQVDGGSFIGRGVHCRAGEVLSPFTSEIEVALASLQRSVAAFSIDVQTTSCADYARCVSAGRCSHRSGCVENKVFVSFEDATAYCKWRGARLPTLDEWQRTMRGTDGRQFVTGEPYDDAACKNKEGGCVVTTPEGVVAHSDGAAEFVNTMECDRGDPPTLRPMAMGALGDLIHPRMLEHATARIRCAQ